MLKKVITKIIGTRFDRELKKIQPIIDKIHEQEKRLVDFSDEQIQAQTPALRARLKERYGELELELGEVRAKVTELKGILGSRDRRMTIVRDELRELRRSTTSWRCSRKCCSISRSGITLGTPPTRASMMTPKVDCIWVCL